MELKLKYTNKKTNSQLTTTSNDKNLNYIISNNQPNKNSWINFGIQTNQDKFMGNILENPQNLKLYKTIEELKPSDTNEQLIEIEHITNKNNQIEIKKKYTNNQTQTTDSIKYNKNNTIELKTIKPQILELDCREINDYSTENRLYTIYENKKNQTTIIKYAKLDKEKKIKYKLYIGINTKNCKLEILQNWREKQYTYSKSRNPNDQNLYTYQALKIIPNNNNSILITSGFSEKEILKNLKNSQTQKKNENENLKTNSQNSTNNKTSIAYNLSQTALKTFQLTQGKKAGFFWFNQIWTRDELASLNVEIENNNNKYVKEKINHYLNLIQNNHTLTRIQEKGALNSPGGIFWLTKRLLDFIKKLRQQKQYYNTYSKKEIKEIFTKLETIFTNIFDNDRNLELELLNTKSGDSWMDTIKINYPLDIQIQLLSMIKNLKKLAIEINNKTKKYQYSLLENFFKNNLLEKYYKNGYLFDDIENTRITSNLFLNYYFYPGLFTEQKWEQIIDKTLPKLETKWGGISSLDNNNEKFQQNYTGENNLSYHNGDSWYWINNLTALILNQINPKKYEKTINKIIESSTKDIIELGTIGYASEISEYANQKPQGCMAQLWSTAFYIEMINKIKNK